eukprot:gene22355-29450_t
MLSRATASSTSVRAPGRYLTPRVAQGILGNSSGSRGSRRMPSYLVAKASNVQPDFFSPPDSSSPFKTQSRGQVHLSKITILEEDLENYFGGGFVDDDDLVSLTSVHFASIHSAGASSAVMENLHMPDEHHKQIPTVSMDQMSAPLPPWAIRAGARKQIYFEPSQVTAAIVTCGGLCPGLNDVVAGLVNKLSDYGVPDGNILGIKYGFRGLSDPCGSPMLLTKRSVDGVQLQGGTILGTSRGKADIKDLVRRIDMMGIDMLFVVGGNGGNAGAHAIHASCQRYEVKCCVVGVPKSIDNDVLLIDKCFGFDTAVEEAQRALQAAKVEASSARRGIGLVKLMGRQSGFLALQASLASDQEPALQHVNYEALEPKLLGGNELAFGTGKT